MAATAGFAQMGLQAARAQVCVLGGGVVGTAIARELAQRGVETILLEKNRIGSGVSGGNTGIACTLLGVAKDSLERQCLERALPLNLPTYQSLGLPHKAAGALYVAWSSGEAQTLEVLAEEAGEECRRLNAEELLTLEPQLATSAQAALLVPGETTVDPGLVPLAFAADAHRCGAHVWERTAQASIEEVCGAWRLRLPGLLQSPILTQHLVNCTGLTAPHNSTKTDLRFKPRRGDYLLFRRPDASATPPLSRPIGAVPTPLARGVYVWPTVHGDVLCGPTNVEQEHSELPPPSAETLEALRDKAISVCPALAEWPVAGAYAGLRPALDPTVFGSDYFLNTSQKPAGHSFTTVAGVRSTGLTASLGIAKMLCDRLGFAEAASPSPTPASPLLPALRSLAETYAETKGFIELAQRKWLVAHPQTCLGLAATAGVAAMPGPSERSGSAAWLTGIDGRSKDLHGILQKPSGAMGLGMECL